MAARSRRLLAVPVAAAVAAGAGEDAVGEDAAGEDAVVEVSGFPVKENQAGGCVLVVAPMSDVFLTGVPLLNCSSVYGGGGFFKVSSFIAGNGEAAGNVATQGGGLFIAASQETDIEQFDFFNNTVVTFTSSGSAEEVPCTSAECTKAVQEGYKAIVQNPDGTIVEPLFIEMADWIATKSLPDQTPLARLHLITPNRKTALAIRQRAAKIGVTKVLYTDESNMLWNPWPPGQWLE